MTIEAPKRRHELTLKISADTLDDLIHGMQEIQMNLREIGNQSVGGGFSWGHVLEHTVQPDQTHQKYAAELEEFLSTKDRA